MIAAEHPKMAQHQLRKLDRPKSYTADSFERTSFESLPRNFADSLAEQSLASLTLNSLSLPRDSLTLPSLSLIDETSSQRSIFKEGIFGDRSLAETVKHIEHKLAEGGAGTNSFSNLRFQEELSTRELSNIEHREQIAAREAGTNSFSKSFLDRILSLRKRLQIFLLSSFQLTCAALLLGTYRQSLSERLCRNSVESLSEQLCRNSFQGFQLCRSNLDSLIRQLDLVTSLSLALLVGSKNCRTRLQQNLSKEKNKNQKLDENNFEFHKKSQSACINKLEQQHFSHNNSNKKLDCRPGSLREKEAVEQLVNTKLLFNQLQRKPLEAKKHKEQLREQPVPDRALRHLHLQQLHDQDQPFKGTKHLPKEQCFTSCLLRQMISSFSKKELERLHLTRSTLEQDEHKKQLKQLQSQQLCAGHLAVPSFHRNRQQTQQLVQQSFDIKMEKKQLRNLRSQLRLEHLDRAFSRMSLEQLTLSPSGSRSFSSYLLKGELPQQSALRMTRTVQRRALEPLLFKSFQLTSAALPLATLVAFSLGAYQHKSFQLPMQQLCLGWAQGGVYPHRALPSASSTSLHRTALTLISLSFAIDAWLKPSSKRAWRRRPLRTTSSSKRAWKRTTLITTTWRTSTWSTFSTASTPTFTTRTRSLRRTTLLSMFLLSFDSSMDTSSNSLSCMRDLQLEKQPVLPTNAWAQNLQSRDQLHTTWCSNELVETEVANLAAKPLQLSQLQQQIQDNQQELEQQEQERQLAEYLAFNQQLQNHSSHQLSLEKNNFRETILNNELAMNLETQKESLENVFYYQLSKEMPRDELTSQSSLFGSLVYKKTFAAFKELVEKNFYKENLSKHTFDKTAAGAYREQLSAAGCLAASENKQLLRCSLSQQSVAKAASLQELSPAYSQRATGRKALLQDQLPEAQLADKNFYQNTLAATSLHTRSSAQQLQRQQLEEETFTAHSFEALCLSSLEESSLTENSFEENDLEETSLTETRFEENSFKEETFKEETFPQESFTDSSLAEETLSESSFENSSFADSGLDKGSFTESSLAPSSLPRSSFEQSSLNRSSLTKSSFDKHSFYQSPFDESSFGNSSFNQSSFEESSFDQSSLEESSFKSSFEQSSLEPNSFEDSSKDSSS